MRVKIGPYKNWLGPYQLAEKLCFWAPKVVDKHGFKSKPDWVHSLGEFFAHGWHKSPDKSRLFDHSEHTTWLYRLLLWIDKRRTRTVKVKIDRWDSWSADHTLALVILPLLKQLQQDKHGAPYVDPEDVPEHLRPEPGHKQYENGDTDPFHFQRWDWVLDEMIFAFEHIVDDDWESEYSTGNIDMRSVPVEFDADGNPTMFQLERGPEHTYQTDDAAIKRIDQRISNGLILFGKYFRALWT